MRNVLCKTGPMLLPCWAFPRDMNAMDNSTVDTAHVKYVYLDIVGFTKNRSVEAQSDLVGALNNIVRSALRETAIPSEKTILIPTGDGMAIALIEIGRYDVHLALALEILRLIADHNAQTKDPMRQFEVRIGINENVDNLVLDINEKRNVAGQGISLAQRIMDKADAGQILLGHAVYETLRPREKYMSSFRPFNATAKHGVAFTVYQFLSKDFPGLSLTIPSSFAPRQTENLKFTKLVAYFVAHAYTNREFLLSRKSDTGRDYAMTVLLSFLAEDSVEKSETPDHETPTAITWKAGSASFPEQYSYYYKLDFWPLARLASCVVEGNLKRFSEHFENSNYTPTYWLPKKSALEKLCSEYPAIATEFGISI
jgi:class 3 adenylate cyclase